LNGTQSALARTIEELRDPASGYARRFERARVLDLNIGEVQYPLPEQVRAELADALIGIERPWYSSPQGEEELRAAYLDRIGRSGTTTAAEVMVTAGGKEAAWLAANYAVGVRGVGRGAVPVPGWEPYSLWLRAAGCQVTGYDPLLLAADPEYLREIARASAPGLGLLVINYPHNPTGVWMDQGRYDRLLAISAELGVAVVSDEVYRAFAPAPASALLAPAFDPAKDTVVDSCSKWLAAAGLRVGFLTAGPRTVQDLLLYRSSYASCTSVLTQKAAASLLTGRASAEWLAAVRAQVADGRQAVADHLAAAGVTVETHGGLYLWCGRPDDTEPVATTSQERAVLADGAGFGAPGHVRVCTARAGLDAAVAARAIVATLKER
jgi:aspartate/methionine/tyrosine aminotransferase